MPAHKLTRKQLKHDGFMEWTAQASEYVQTNYTRIGIGVLVVIVAIVGVRLFQQGQTRSAQRASYLLYQGQSLLLRGDFMAARGPLQEAHERFGGTVFGKQAALGLAQAQMAAGEPEAALSTVQAARRGLGGRDPLQVPLLKAQAATLINLQRYAEAEEVYRDGLSRQDLSATERYDLTVSLADCLKLASRFPEAAAVLVGLRESIDRGELKVDGRDRDLDGRIQLLRALSG